jgi:type I restriction enzyme S subunit
MSSLNNRGAMSVNTIENDWSTLGDVGLIIEAGKNLKCEERPPHAHELGVVKVSAVSGEVFKPNESKTLPISYKPPERDRINAGDLLLARASGSLNLVGRVALVNEAPSNLYLSDKVLRLRVPSGLTDWIYWFLRSPIGRAQIEKAASGISMHNITQGSLLTLKLPLPDYEEQEKCVSVVDAAFAHADRLEAEARRALALLDRLESAILAKAFRGKLVPQDDNDEPASVLLERIRAQRASVQKPKCGRRAAGEAESATA